MRKEWPTPTGTAGPFPALVQTADVLFAWAYMAPFAASLPFFLNPPLWIAALSRPPGAAPAGEKAPAASPLSLVSDRRAR